MLSIITYMPNIFRLCAIDYSASYVIYQASKLLAYFRLDFFYYAFTFVVLFQKINLFFLSRLS